MEKYLVRIEFRYKDAPKYELDTEYKSKTITIGVFDTKDEAIIKGDKALEVFEKHFPLNPHWNVKERFSANGGCFGEFKNIVASSAWITTPFSVFATITHLDYRDVEETINSVLDAQKRYKEYQKKYSED